MFEIVPSILSANFANLELEVKRLKACGIRTIHIDVMDGIFVKNITMGPCVISSLRKCTDLIFDVHLMINSLDLIEDFVAAGADIITIHYEASNEIRADLNRIKALGRKAGVALLPSTEPHVLNEVIDIVDLILVMTVSPGYAGQAFMHSQVDKIKSISQSISYRNIILSVDGGINVDTAKIVVEAGANFLVSGSFIYYDNEVEKNIDLLRLHATSS